MHNRINAAKARAQEAREAADRAAQAVTAWAQKYLAAEQALRGAVIALRRVDQAGYRPAWRARQGHVANLCRRMEAMAEMTRMARRRVLARLREDQDTAAMIAEMVEGIPLRLQAETEGADRG